MLGPKEPLDVLGVEPAERPKDPGGSEAAVGHEHVDMGVEIEAMLLQNVLLPPTCRAVELGHDPAVIGELHLVDPVLEGVQRIAEIVALEITGLDGGKDTLGGEREE